VSREKSAEIDAYIGERCKTVSSWNEVTAQVNEEFQLNWTVGSVQRRANKAGHHLPDRHCIGLMPDRNGILVQCPEVFAPVKADKEYHSTACYNWTFQRLALGYRKGDPYRKGAHTKQHPPKICKEGWTIRDGLIAVCGEPFTRGRTDKKYHSTECLFRTRRWRELGYHLKDSVRQECAYRNCRKGEGGARGTFDRIHRSKSGLYWRDARCKAAETRAQRADKIAAKLAEAAHIRAEAERIIAEQQSRKVQIADAVDRAIPRFVKLMPLLPLRRKTSKELLALGLSSNEVDAIHMPGSRTAKVAARWFISLEWGVPFDTVAQYHKESSKGEQGNLKTFLSSSQQTMFG